MAASRIAAWVARQPGSALSIDGHEIRSVAEYRRWKRASGYGD